MLLLAKLADLRGPLGALERMLEEDRPVRVCDVEHVLSTIAKALVVTTSSE